MGKYDAMLNEKSANAGKLPQLLVEIKAAMAKGAASREELAALAGKYAAEQKRREEAEAMEATASANVVEMTKKYEQAEKTAADSMKEIKELRANYDNLNKTYVALKQASDASNSQKSGLEQTLGEKEHVIAEQDIAINKLKEIIDHYRAAISEIHADSQKANKQ